MPLHRYPIQDYHLEEQGIYTGERWVACVQTSPSINYSAYLRCVYNQLGWKLAVTKNVESVKHGDPHVFWPMVLGAMRYSLHQYLQFTAIV